MSASKTLPSTNPRQATRSWPRATIRELIARAEELGSARAELGSEAEAKLFRFAIYNFRNSAQIGQNLFVTLDCNSVILTRRQDPAVVIIQ